MVVADKLGWKLSRARAASLPEPLPSWKPFADPSRRPHAVEPRATNWEPVQHGLHVPGRLKDHSLAVGGSVALGILLQARKKRRSKNVRFHRRADWSVEFLRNQPGAKWA